MGDYRDYHLETYYQRNSLLGHSLDWSNRPSTIKSYRHRPEIPLPPAEHIDADFFAAALNAGASLPRAQPPRAGEVACALNLSAGVTEPRFEDGYLLGARACASAGGLYPAELYVAASQVEGMEDGLYHFTPLGPAWRRLWPQNLSPNIAAALGAAPARLTFFITAILWRSLWKYNARGYRYCLLDAGHLLANVELLLSALSLTPRTCLNFADNTVSTLLSLADQDEVPLAAIQAGGELATAGPQAPNNEFILPPLDLQPNPIARRIGRDYHVLAVHQPSKLDVPQKEFVWQGARMEGKPLTLPPPSGGGISLEEVLHGRRSRRAFKGKPLSAMELSRLLSATLPHDNPFLAAIILGAGGELKAGSYIYAPQRRQLLPRSLGQDWRRIVADACLGQAFLAKASLQLIFFADFDMLEKRTQPRTYRQLMLAAGRAGQRCYLAATALGLNCCGVGAFYDGDLAAIDGMPPRAQPLYVVACG
jgi:SagB-type dehydrogenase family enzyme